MPNHTFMNVQVPIEFDSEVRALAAKLRISRSKLIRLALEKFMEQVKEDNEGGNRGKAIVEQ